MNIIIIINKYLYKKEQPWSHLISKFTLMNRMKTRIAWILIWPLAISLLLVTPVGAADTVAETEQVEEVKYVIQNKKQEDKNSSLNTPELKRIDSPNSLLGDDLLGTFVARPLYILHCNWTVYD